MSSWEEVRKCKAYIWVYRRVYNLDSLQKKKENLARELGVSEAESGGIEAIEDKNELQGSSLASMVDTIAKFKSLKAKKLDKAKNAKNQKSDSKDQKNERNGDRAGSNKPNKPTNVISDPKKGKKLKKEKNAKTKKNEQTKTNPSKKQTKGRLVNLNDLDLLKPNTAWDSETKKKVEDFKTQNNQELGRIYKQKDAYDLDYDKGKVKKVRGKNKKRKKAKKLNFDEFENLTGDQKMALKEAKNKMLRKRKFQRMYGSKDKQLNG